MARCIYCYREIDYGNKDNYNTDRTKVGCPDCGEQQDILDTLHTSEPIIESFEKMKDLYDRLLKLEKRMLNHLTEVK